MLELPNTKAELEKKLAELGPEQKARLFAKLRQQKPDQETVPSQPPLTPRGREDWSYPLSFGQQRLWFLNLYEPESPEYNIPQAFLIDGVLDPVLLERALQQVVVRHETLRTTFVAQEGVPFQRVPEIPRVTIPVTDLVARDGAAWDEEKAWHEAMGVARNDAKQPFNLETGPMLRAQLFRVAPERWLLYLNVHHIAYDQWSMGILTRELAAFYEAGVEGRSAELAPLPVQYLDYGIWQREWLSGETLERQLSFWRRTLSGVPPLDLPTDRPRPPVRTTQGDTLPFPLDPAIGQGLRALAAAEGATLFMVLSAAMKALLHHYTGQSDLALGTLIANRRRAEAEAMIGFFANTLVLRSDLAGDPTFRELVRREREVALEAYAHQDLPFEKLVDELNPPRDLARTPLFQAMLILLNAPGEALKLPGARLGMVAIDSRTSKMEMSLYMTGGEDRLSGYLEYNTDLWDASTLERFLGHFRTLLEAFTASPDLKLSAAPLLGPEERQHLLYALNATAAPAPHQTLPRLIAARAAERPTATAVEMDGAKLTYAELEARANGFARFLVSKGVGPETLVGVCLERSLDLLPVLLGVGKAGGAYVPLDPEYPRHRLEQMLGDSKAPVVVTQEKLMATLPESHATVIAIDRDREAIAAFGTEPYDAGTGTDHLAYIIYTSGSTGTPKGVQVSHGALTNFLASMARKPGMTADDTLLAVTTLSFDIAGLELYLPLTTGARLVLVSKDDAQAGERLMALLDGAGVTVMQATPATWRLLFGAGWKGNSALKVLCGGEALPRDLAAQIAAATQELWNVYGPTEATIWSTLDRVQGDRTQGGEAPVTIGLPLANTQVHLVSRHGSVVPLGVPGELLIGGAGLARGYRGKAAMTAERFVPDPFSAKPGARLYRTGDLARRLPDGRIDFLGRIDHQVKVRGFRIELGEIESGLLAHPAVAQAVVLAREDSPGSKRLVAYLVAREGQELPATPELKTFLKERLPEYMVPAFFVPLPAFPLTPNGKVDRRSLPAPDAKAAQAPYVAPRNAQEEKMAEIWAEVLNLKQVGVNDDFFDLGGDSLLVVRVVTKAAKAGISITTKQAFQHKTIAELIEASGSTNIIAEQGPVVGVHPWTPAMLHFQDLRHPNEHFHSTGTLLEFRGEKLDMPLMRQTLKRVETHHDTLRLRVVGQRDAPDRHLVQDPPGREPALIQLDLSVIDPEQRERVMSRLAKAIVTSYDLERGPLFKGLVFEAQKGVPKELFLTAHFYSVDLGSWVALLDDVDTVYRQLAAGEDATIQPKTTSGVDWAKRLVERAAPGGMTDEERQYWLAQAPHQPTRITFDHETGPNDWTAAMVERYTLSVEDTEILLTQAPRAFGVQIDGILVAAILEAFAGWTKERSLPIVLLGHGREPLYDDMDISRTVGWFNSMYPVNVELGTDTKFDAEARHVNTQLRKVPHGGMGYGILKYLGGSQADSEHLRQAPWPQVFFNYVGPDNARELKTFRKVQNFGGYFLDYKTKRLTPIVLTGMIVDEALLIKWEWSVNLHNRETIVALAERCQEVLAWFVNEYRRRQANVAQGAVKKP